MKSKVVYLIGFLLISCSGLTQSKGTLIIEISGFRNDEGKVAVSVHDHGAGFPGGEESRVTGTLVEINKQKAIAVIEGLPFGEYAISVFHDENDNGELDTNWIGMPKEGIGASNNARSKMGPPKYEDAKFDFNQNEQRISFKMKYL
jgi:uncharacterized protein (DUF2141 family)